MTPTPRSSLAALCLSLCALAGPLACAPSSELASSQSAPSGSGGFDPGEGAPTTSGSGASGASYPGADATAGAGGAIDPGPPQCDDSLKQCAQEITYPAGSETTVELHGDFASDGWSAGVPMTKSGDHWSATVTLPYDGTLTYKFVVDGLWVTDPDNPDQVDDGFGGKNSVKTGLVCDDWTCAPDTTGDFDWRDAVMYFVFVDRFVDGDPTNDGSSPAGVEQPASYRGGDWAGVQQKIEDGYFNDLGVNTLWLTVPVDNTEDTGFGSDGHAYTGYHGYWPKDLGAAEEHFGTLADLASLVSAAHDKGLKVILDYAMNHVHESSPVYAAHPDWFWPLNDASVQNCTCGGGCSWDGPQGKRCWFTDYLPDFNFTVDAARAFSVDNALQWIKDTDIDGYRLDAVKHVEDSWITDLRARVTSEIEPGKGRHFYMVGETFTGDQGLIKYYVDPSMLDGQFDFPLRAQILRTMLMRAPGTTMQGLDGFLAANDGYYGAGIMSTFIGNHDVPRAIHFAEDAPLWGTGDGAEWTNGKDRSWSGTPALPSGKSAFERVANAFTLLYTMKGIPLVYYGDEVGMPGGGDPDNRRMMQWSGYSAGQSALFAHMKKLGAVRAKHESLRKGKRTSLSSGADTMAYEMSYNADVVYVAMNRGDADAVVSGLPAQPLVDELTSETTAGPSVTVPARSAKILVAQ